MADNKLHVYIVTADYRPDNDKKPTYRCAAANKTTCRRKFEHIFCWLKVYSVENAENDNIDDDVLIL